MEHALYDKARPEVEEEEYAVLYETPPEDAAVICLSTCSDEGTWSRTCIFGYLVLQTGDVT